MHSNPVQEYYDKKKARYLKDAAGAARGMTTGTPVDWEDSERYLKDLPERRLTLAAPTRGELDPVDVPAYADDASGHRPSRRCVGAHPGFRWCLFACGCEPSSYDDDPAERPRPRWACGLDTGQG